MPRLDFPSAIKSQICCSRGVSVSFTFKCFLRVREFFGPRAPGPASWPAAPDQALSPPSSSRLLDQVSTFVEIVWETAYEEVIADAPYRATLCTKKTARSSSDFGMSSRVKSTLFPSA